MAEQGNGRRRPVIRDGVLSWVAPNHPSVGQPFVPFSGRGRSLSDEPPSTPMQGGPLSAENVGFLRRAAERHPGPQYYGLRHTTDSLDRMRAALTGRVDPPGFQGDAYGLVPELNRELRARFPQFPNQGFSGDDRNFNRAVHAAIGNSVEWDISRAGPRMSTVGDLIRHISDNTQFAVADMGGAPRSDEHDRYGQSTQKFGRRTVAPNQVVTEVSTPADDLASGVRQRRLSLSTPMHASHARALADTFTESYGRAINRSLDRVRRIDALNREPIADRRQRLAAAVELRLLRAQGRGAPSVRRQNRETITRLEATVRRRPRGG